ncbi:hypothetical protein OHC33_010657 [Knufia fluminis]|uniref:Protein FYV10 n=1 Tax=Knufia fluminis TaxID=191047 RepID=A0AAN8I184_9EURO|nr:hypothetical protein OHC33_010657 [Knufia fluminis]
MAAVAASTPTAYLRTLESLNLPKHELNKVVMDFLVQSGYPEAASRFAEEANMSTNAENSLMEERVRIKNAIYQGDLQTAIEEINEIDVSILDNDPALIFSLLRLQLIELIKKISPAPESEKPTLTANAITFAQQNLSPYTPRDPKFKHDLERAMGLMIVPKEVWSSPDSLQSEQFSMFGHLYELIDPSHKMEVAQNVNAAILRFQGRQGGSKIQTILQTRAWSEGLAREKRIDLPRDLTVSLRDTPPDSQNGNGDTQMTEDAEESGDALERYTNIHQSPR